MHTAIFRKRIKISATNKAKKTNNTNKYMTNLYIKGVGRRKKLRISVKDNE